MTKHNIISDNAEIYMPAAISHGPPLILQPQTPLTLPAILRGAADKPQEIIYIQEGSVPLYQSYAGLLQEASELLTGLQQLGLKPGDKAILQFEHNEQFILAFWSCLLGGIVPVLLPVVHSTKQMNAWQKLHNAYMTAHEPYIYTSMTVSQEWTEDQVAEIPREKLLAIERLLQSGAAWRHYESRPDDLAILALTSGSTGNAKLVMLTHRNIISQIRGIAQVKHLSAADVSLNWMPLDHLGSIGTHIRDVDCGIKQVQVATETILKDPLRWLDLMDRYRVTLTRAPNFAYRLVNEQEQSMTRRN